jgi:tol-pal system protein YbgF
MVFPFLSAIRVFALACVATAVVSAASAQEGERSPGGLLDRIFGGSERFGGGERVAQPAAQPGQERAALAASDVVLQLERLEGQIRQLTGAVEQLQFRNQQLEQQVRRMQEDTEYRFQELGSKGTARPAPTRPQATPAPTAPTAPAASSAPGRRGDAFDPAQHPGAPGVPRTLGSIPAGAAPPGAGTNPDDPSVGAPGGRAPGAHTAALPPGASAKGDYDLAYGYVLRKDYPLAEEAFRNFLKKYPSDQMAGEATFWLGESLFQRQRYREAAESFLNVSTKFEANPRGPDALLRLGQSLAALGEKEAACASLGEVSRKFPRASTSLKQSVEREQKRVRC